MTHFKLIFLAALVLTPYDFLNLNLSGILKHNLAHVSEVSHGPTHFPTFLGTLLRLDERPPSPDDSTSIALPYLWNTGIADKQ